MSSLGHGSEPVAERSAFAKAFHLLGRVTADRSFDDAAHLGRPRESSTGDDWEPFSRQVLRKLLIRAERRAGLPTKGAPRALFLSGAPVTFVTDARRGRVLLTQLPQFGPRSSFLGAGEHRKHAISQERTAEVRV